MDFFDTGFFTPRINLGLFIVSWLMGIVGLCV